MKRVLHFVGHCFYCNQRNLYMSTLSRSTEIYCQKKCLPLNTLPHIIMNQNVAIYRTLHPRTLYLTAERLSRIGVGGDHLDHQISNYPDDIKKEKTLDSVWAVRLAIENGYLSWCRNTYLATVLGVAMQAEGLVAMSQHAAEGAFFIAGLNLMWGSGTFISNTLLLRRKIQMSFPTALFQVTATLLHFVIWACVVVMYLDFVEDDQVAEVPEDGLPESSFKSV